MKKMKKFCIFIIIFSALFFTGCASKDAGGQPGGEAAVDLHERFAEMFDEEPAPETSAPTPAADTESCACDPDSLRVIIAEVILDILDNMDTESLESIIAEAGTAAAAVQEEKFAITPSGTRYHVQGCRHAQNVKELLTRAEAEERRYEPCRTCDP